MEHSEVRRVARLNYLLLGLLTICFLFSMFLLLGRWLDEVSGPKLRVHWEGSQLQFRVSNDGPYVVTHLLLMHLDRGPIAAARLPEPVVIYSSGGRTLDVDTWKKLKWLDGQTPVPAPQVGSPLDVLFYLPSRANWGKGMTNTSPDRS